MPLTGSDTRIRPLYSNNSNCDDLECPLMVIALLQAFSSTIFRIRGGCAVPLHLQNFLLHWLTTLVFCVSGDWAWRSALHGSVCVSWCLFSFSLWLLCDIISVLQQNRLRYYRHVLRKEDYHWVKKCMEYEVEVPDQRGLGQRLKDCQTRKLSREDALDHSKWRKQIRDDWCSE